MFIISSQNVKKADKKHISSSINALYKPLDFINHRQSSELPSENFIMKEILYALLFSILSVLQGSCSVGYRFYGIIIGYKKFELYILIELP